VHPPQANHSGTTPRASHILPAMVSWMYTKKISTAYPMRA
jgi:hypothetical protein